MNFPGYIELSVVVFFIALFSFCISQIVLHLVEKKPDLSLQENNHQETMNPIIKFQINADDREDRKEAA